MILYHGTRAAFVHFTPASIGRGGEANAALGIWATRCPHTATLYGGDARLMILSVAAPRLAFAACRQSAIWGGPDLEARDREIALPRFAAARTTLMAQGLDGVWCEMPGTDLAESVCLFDPDAISTLDILERPTPEVLDRLETPDDDSVVDFGVRLEEALDAPARTGDPAVVPGRPADPFVRTLARQDVLSYA